MGEVDHRADLWALGCIVYECLTGQTVWSVEQGVAMILAQIASAPLPRPEQACALICRSAFDAVVRLEGARPRPRQAISKPRVSSLDALANALATGRLCPPRARLAITERPRRHGQHSDELMAEDDPARQKADVGRRRAAALARASTRCRRRCAKARKPITPTGRY